MQKSILRSIESFLIWPHWTCGRPGWRRRRGHRCLWFEFCTRCWLASTMVRRRFVGDTL